MFLIISILVMVGCKKTRIRLTNEKASFVIGGKNYEFEGNEVLSMNWVSGSQYSIGASTSDFEGVEGVLVIQIGPVYSSTSSLKPEDFENQLLVGDYTYFPSGDPFFGMGPKIEWNDSYGETWSSDNGVQPNSSEFFIDRILFSKNNDMFQVKGGFSCLVWNSSGDSRSIEHGQFKSIFYRK